MQLMSVLSCCGNSLMYLCSLCAARRDSRSCGLPMMLRPFRFCLTTDYNRSGLYWNPVNLCRKRVQGYQLATNMTVWGTFQASATNRRMDHCYWIHRPGLGWPRRPLPADGRCRPLIAMSHWDASCTVNSSLEQCHLRVVVGSAGPGSLHAAYISVSSRATRTTFSGCRQRTLMNHARTWDRWRCCECVGVCLCAWHHHSCRKSKRNI